MDLAEKGCASSTKGWGWVVQDLLQFSEANGESNFETKKIFGCCWVRKPAKVRREGRLGFICRRPGEVEAWTKV